MFLSSLSLLLFSLLLFSFDHFRMGKETEAPPTTRLFLSSLFFLSFGKWFSHFGLNRILGSLWSSLMNSTMKCSLFSLFSLFFLSISFFSFYLFSLFSLSFLLFIFFLGTIFMSPLRKISKFDFFLFFFLFSL